MSQKLPSLENLLPAKILTPDAVMQDVNRKISLGTQKIERGLTEILSIPVELLREATITVKVILPEP